VRICQIGKLKPLLFQILSVILLNHGQESFVWISRLSTVIGWSFEVFACSHFSTDCTFILFLEILIDTNDDSHWALLGAIVPQRTVIVHYSLDRSPLVMILNGLLWFHDGGCEQFGIATRCAFNYSFSFFFQTFFIHFVQLLSLFDEHISLQSLIICCTHRV